jgi:hypothetical protein
VNLNDSLRTRAASIHAGAAVYSSPNHGLAGFDFERSCVKKKLGALVLTLASLVISAACASSGPSPNPKPPEPDSGETWAKAGPSAVNRPAKAASVHAASLASR